MKEYVITNDGFEDYAEKYSTPEDAALAELNQKTWKEIPGAQMISGPLQGKVLEFLSRMIQPKYILELGTYTGYSAICLAKGLKSGGELHTIDNDDRYQDLRDQSWAAEGLSQTITQHIGQGVDIIPELKQPFDLVFLDADKRNYGTYFDLVFNQMPSGSWLLADNVLFHGEVILPEEERGKAAKFIHQFNEKIAVDNRVEQVIMPIRDGLMIIRKK